MKLSTRSRNIIENQAAKTKKELIHAINTNRFRPGKVRNLGKKSFAEICAWLGLPISEKRRCPHCGKPI